MKITITGVQNGAELSEDEIIQIIDVLSQFGIEEVKIEYGDGAK